MKNHRLAHEILALIACASSESDAKHYKYICTFQLFDFQEQLKFHVQSRAFIPNVYRLFFVSQVYTVKHSLGPTADPGVASSIPVQSHTFVEIDHELISTVILLPVVSVTRESTVKIVQEW